MRQIPIEMPFSQTQERDNFIVGDCNSLALATIDQWPTWQGEYRALNIVGPRGAGKSHLAEIWRSKVEKSQKLYELKPGQFLPESIFYVLDNLNSNSDWDEEELFHCFNHCKNDEGGLLILSRKPVGQMKWQLPDLRSRMRAVNVINIQPPDDALLYALLEKYFLDRQVIAPSDMLNYIVSRMERSFIGLQKIATAVDRYSIEKQKPLSISLARAAFDRLLKI